jgi:SAM-dependent methyltransferase
MNTIQAARDTYRAEYVDFQHTPGAIEAELNARRFRKHFELSDTVLDFGCGQGHLLETLLARELIGVERNPADRERLQRATRLVKVYGDISEVRPSSVDTIISNHSLDNVLDPVKILRDLRVRLRPGGKAVLVVRFDDCLDRRAFRSRDANRHVHTWTPQFLGNILREAGFEDARIDVRIFYDAWLPSFVKIYRSRLVSEAMFQVLCAATALLTRRRELRAIASVPGEKVRNEFMGRSCKSGAHEACPALTKLGIVCDCECHQRCGSADVD